MHEHVPHDHDLNALEQRLRGWQPDGGRLDRDRTLFEAGRAAAGPPRRSTSRALAWPAVTALAATLALAVGLAWRSERAERLALERVLVQRPPAPTAPAEHDPRLLARELDPVPQPHSGSNYLYLIRHLVSEPASGDRGTVSESPPSADRTHRPAPGREPQPLRPRDFNRLITL